jgi:hypothetical protein
MFVKNKTMLSSISVSIEIKENLHLALAKTDSEQRCNMVRYGVFFQLLNDDLETKESGPNTKIVFGFEY